MDPIPSTTPTLRRDEVPSLRSAVVTTLRRDRLLQWTAGSFVAVALLYLLPLQAALRPQVLSRRVFPFFFLTLALLALRRGRSQLPYRQERVFWSDLVKGFGCWWAVAFLLLFFPDVAKPLWVDVVAEVGYGLLYVALLLAVDREPHRRDLWRPAGLERALAWPAVSILVGGLVVYFVLVPLVTDPEEYATSISSITLYLALDLYLAIKLAYLSATSRGARWQYLYSLLTTTIALMFVSDLVEGWTYYTGVTWTWTHSVGFLWNLPFVTLVAAARLRHHRFSTTAEPSSAEPVLEQFGFPGPSGRTLISGLAFALLHFGIYHFDLLGKASETVREAVVCLWLTFLGAVALVQHWLLENKARRLWFERARAEEIVRRSEQALLLVLERQQAAARLNASEERFRKTFRSSPDGMAILTVADGTCLAVNESFSRLAERPKDELEGQVLSDLGMWNDGFRRRLEELGEHEAVSLRLEIRSPRGERTFLVSVDSIEHAAQACRLLTVHDVTSDRHFAAEGDSSRLLDEADDAAAVIDLDDRIVYWNRSAERLYGWSANEVLGRTARDLFLPEEAAEWRQHRHTVIENGRWSGRLRLLTRDGEVVEVDSLWTLVYDAEGTPQSTLVLSSRARSS